MITLNNPEKLADLIYELEQGKRPMRFTTDLLFIISVSSTDYPELKKLYVIPKTPVPNIIQKKTGRIERDKWFDALFSELERHKDITLDDILILYILIPGVIAETARFDSPRKKIKVRFISALEHLWLDRLHIEKTDRIHLLDNLSSRWKTIEESEYIKPAISPLNSQHPFSCTASALLNKSDPEFPKQGLTVIYGPGGIGKTHFLRRLTYQYTKQSENDLSQGIPVFIRLPLILHSDVLENCLSHFDGFKNLSNIQIKALISYGIIIPFLDAFDELARGTVRLGCQQFLKALGNTIKISGVGLLTSRDYYLHIDPLIPIALRQYNIAELLFGFFSKQERRNFIQRKIRFLETYSVHGVLLILMG